MIVRYLSSAALGLAVTTALLWAMQYLIEQTDMGPGRESVPIHDWFQTVRKDSELNTDEPKPEPIDPYVTPPKIRPVTETGEKLVIIPDHGRLAPPIQNDFRPKYLGPANGSLVAIVQVHPEYPQIASQRGIEGFVDVTFDVSESGAVVNVSVVESSHAVFEKAAIRAAQRSRYKPRIVDGIALPSTGLMKRYRFEMKN